MAEELTTRAAFVRDVSREWARRLPLWLCLVAASTTALLAVLLGGNVLAWATLGGMTGLALGCGGFLVPVLGSWYVGRGERRGWWKAVPPTGFVATHALPCGRIRGAFLWPVGGTLYLRPGSAVFVRWKRPTLWVPQVQLGPRVEAVSHKRTLPARWLVPGPAHVLELRDTQRRVRFVVAEPHRTAARVASVLEWAESRQQEATPDRGRVVRE